MKTRKRRGGFLGKMLRNNINKQQKQADILRKENIKVVKTNDMQIGKKYSPILHQGKSNEFTLKSIELYDFQPPNTDKTVKKLGKTYVITANEWYFSAFFYENELFVEVNSNIKGGKSRRNYRCNRTRKVAKY